MKILVTGGAGYLGSVLVPRLIACEHDVTVLDNFMHGQQSLNALCWNPHFDVVKGDARDFRIMQPLLDKADAVIPLAAIVGAPACDADVYAATSTNTDAIGELAMSMGVGQMLLIPITNSGYGIGEPGKECDEESPLRPVSLYGKTKVQAEKCAFNHGNTISFRLATVFGMSPRMRLDLLVNNFVWHAVVDLSVVLFEPHARRNYVHVRDVADVFVHGLHNFGKMKGKAYNVGLSSANLTKAELCGRIKAIIPEFTWFEAPIGEDPDKRDYLVSNARIEATGFKPLRTIEDGVAELMKGYRMMRGTAYGNA